MKVQKHALNDIGVAVDIGSTSIGVCCVDLKDNSEMLSFSFGNPQCRYGADIITRIKKCIEELHLLDDMRMCVENALHDELRDKLKEQYGYITNIVYSGNTTMLHIMKGLSVEGLAYAPFQLVDLSYCKESIDGIMYHYLPGFSAFIGADILSGAFYLQMGKQSSYDLLIDLGTNGEMLLMNREHGYAISTACGPVFDHVVCGAKYGSDCISIIANCVKRGLIDEKGTLAEAFFDSGIVVDRDFVIKQDHIRNFQLAKGAIYAGIYCLIEKAQIAFDEIDNVYISGGLGFHMNVNDACYLKMMPEELRNKMVVSGNTSLEGAKKCLIHFAETKNLSPHGCVECFDEMFAIQTRTESFELANYPGFQNRYMSSLEFN